jgi:hypothetical protein
MPVIGGMCVPNICFKAEFNIAAAALAAIKQDGTPVVDPVKLQALMMFYGAAYDAALARFNTPVVQGCDGCRCVYTTPNPPWIALPPYHLGFDNVSNYTVQIAGITVRLWWGMCHPPGAKIKVGKKFIPVEEFTDGLPPKSSAPGGGSSGKKGKGGKKKPGKTSRGRR